MSWILIFLGILLIIGIYIIIQYNKLIKLRNNRENAFADIDVQLKQRFDLVPNLINTVKWYAKQETWIYDKIIEARKSFTEAKWVDDKVQANNMLTWALKSLFAFAENNPEIKSNKNFMQLQTELGDIENKIAAARRFFNSSTKEYNTYLQLFPTNLIAKIFNFTQKDYFELEDRENQSKNPTVKF